MKATCDISEHAKRKEVTRASRAMVRHNMNAAEYRAAIIAGQPGFIDGSLRWHGTHFYWQQDIPGLGLVSCSMPVQGEESRD